MSIRDRAETWLLVFSLMGMGMGMGMNDLTLTRVQIGKWDKIV